MSPTAFIRVDSILSVPEGARIVDSLNRPFIHRGGLFYYDARFIHGHDLEWPIYLEEQNDDPNPAPFNRGPLGVRNPLRHGPRTAGTDRRDR